MHTVRWFTRIGGTMREANKVEKTAAEKSHEDTKKILGSEARMHRVTDFDKKLLVWVKRYPNVADVPTEVTSECILSARSKARIKICNYMIVVTIIGCVISVILGKRQAERGDTLKKQREEWFENVMARERSK